MPQPLSQVRSGVKVIKWSPDALNDKPELAVLVAGIFAASACIDHEMGMLLGRVLGADAAAALAISAKLESQNLQRIALKAAAKAVMTENDYKIFQAVTSVTESAQAERHRLAHWLWGACEELQTSLLLMDPKYFRQRESNLDALAKSVDSLDSLLGFRKVLCTTDYSKIFVYTLDDLSRAKRDLVETFEMLRTYQFYVSPTITSDEAVQLGLDEHGFGTRAGALRKLSSLPLFHQALDREQGKVQENRNNRQSQP